MDITEKQVRDECDGQHKISYLILKQIFGKEYALEAVAISPFFKKNEEL